MKRFDGHRGGGDLRRASPCQRRCRHDANPMFLSAASCRGVASRGRLLSGYIRHRPLFSPG